MILPRGQTLQRRDSSTVNFTWVALGVFVLLLLLSIILISNIRRHRLSHPDPPSFLFTRYLKNKWRAWTPGQARRRRPSSPMAHSRNHSRGTPLTARTSSEIPTSSIRTSTEPSTLDHRLSVRSIATLPPYHVSPLPSERLIAREGERGGVDTVVEFPETEEDVEERREEEMEALFNIRQARRREAEDRANRRLERQQARERGDWRRLDELEQESHARARDRAASDATLLSVGGESGTNSRSNSTTNLVAPNQDSAYLIAQLTSLRETNQRKRRVSSVSYAELGLARHDGSRIRADSMESDHRPLLDSAAPISGQRSRATSRASSRDRARSITSTTRFGHGRHASEVSFVSPDGDRGRGIPLLTPQSSEELPPEPPSYDDDISAHGGEAPPYSSPVLERFPQTPAPAHVAAAGTVERAVSPSGLEGEERIEREEERQGEDGREQGTKRQEEEHTVEQSQQQEHNPPPPAPRQRPRLTTETSSIPPAIEFISATPVDSVPHTPLDARFGGR